jgi:hypothetical protein
MSRILKMSDQQAIQALAAKGFSLRWISRELNINRRTVARYAAAPAAKCTTEPGKVTAGSGSVEESKCTTPEGKVTAGSRSSCALHAGVIEAMAADRFTAQQTWADLRATHGFESTYEAVKRFVKRLKARTPQRVWRVELQPSSLTLHSLTFSATVKLWASNLYSAGGFPLSSRALLVRAMP